ncbi:heat shock protein Hsp20 [Rhizocola hellebori]|uniref:Heat shock protein Hsp20 n=1 Tax=Rhizocola hellebori TaxID=1392758 RepID=A0A8J3Q2H3_9ACTN|nr:Hsp20/alpha crystallin family protein [Rhizocola hellebori]GIH02135.1 heat shock protein Hsp20 [Rhizocola hellebori]
MTNLTLLTRRDPFASFDSVLLRRGFGPAQKDAFVPAAEIVRDGTDAVVRVELPGVDITKDVTVELTNGRLVIHGERRDERAEDSSVYRLREVRYGSFRRSFTVPRHVTAEALSADYSDGVLTVRVSGAFSDDEPKRIAINGATAEPATES